MKHQNTLHLTRGGLIAALYVALTGVSALFGVASGAVQVRLSEALCVLPVFLPEAVPGLFVGCLLSNLLFGAGIPDVLLGSLATLIGAVGALLWKKLPEKLHFLASVPTIIANTAAVPFIIMIASGGGETARALPYLLLTVGIGEIVSAGILGTALYFAFRRRFSPQ